MRYYVPIECREAPPDFALCSGCFGAERLSREDFEKNPTGGVNTLVSSVEAAVNGGNQKAMVLLLRNLVLDHLTGPNVANAQYGRSGQSYIPSSIGHQSSLRMSVLKLLGKLDFSDPWVVAATEKARAELAGLVRRFGDAQGDGLTAVARDGQQWQKLFERLQKIGGFEGTEIEILAPAKKTVWAPLQSEFVAALLPDTNGETGTLQLSDEMRLEGVLHFGPPPLLRGATIQAAEDDTNIASASIAPGGVKTGSSGSGRRIVSVGRVVLDAGSKLRLIGIELRVEHDMEIRAGATLQCYNCEIRGAQRIRASGKGSVLQLKDSSIVGCGSHGIECVDGASLLGDGLSIEHSAGAGLHLERCGKVSLKHCCISGNEGTGVFVKEPMSGPVKLHWTTIRQNGGGRITWKRPRETGKKAAGPQAGGSSSSSKPYVEVQPTPKELAHALRACASSFRSHKEHDVESLRSSLTHLLALPADIPELLDSRILAAVEKVARAHPKKLGSICGQIVDMFQDSTRLAAYLDEPGERYTLKSIAGALSGLPKDLGDAGRALRSLHGRQPAPSCAEILKHKSLIEALNIIGAGGSALAPLPALAQHLVSDREFCGPYLAAQRVREAVCRLRSDSDEGDKIAALEILEDLRPDMDVLLVTGLGLIVRDLADDETSSVPSSVRERATHLLASWAEPSADGALADIADSSSPAFRGGPSDAESWLLATTGAGQAPIADIVKAVSCGKDFLLFEKQIGAGRGVTTHSIGEAVAKDMSAGVSSAAELTARAERQAALARLQASLHVAVMCCTGSPQQVKVFVEELTAAGWLGRDGGVNGRLIKLAPPPTACLAMHFKDTLKEVMLSTKLEEARSRVAAQINALVEPLTPASSTLAVEVCEASPSAPVSKSRKFETPPRLVPPVQPGPRCTVVSSTPAVRDRRQKRHLS